MRGSMGFYVSERRSHGVGGTAIECLGCCAGARGIQYPAAVFGSGDMFWEMSAPK